MIVFVTNRPQRMTRLRVVLRAVGLDAEPAVVSPSHFVEAADEALVFIDGRSAPSPEMMARARRNAPNSRIVLCMKAVTPNLVRLAMDCGLDGVLSTALSVEETAEILEQICQGERQVRFGSASSPMVQKAAQAAADFDGFWMFGTVQES